ncbi:paraquat-inducible protein A [Vibrio sp. AK197]
MERYRNTDKSDDVTKNPPRRFQRLEGHLSQVTGVRICQGCELVVDAVSLPRGKNAYCPRCGTQLYRGGSPSLSGNLSIALTCVILFIPAYFFNFISIRLVGVNIPASLPSGMFSLFEDGFYFLSVLVLFCSCIAPFLVCLSVVGAHAALHYKAFKPFKLCLDVFQKLKHWAMIDVFLISVAISCFKLQDYSDIFIGPALYGLVLLQLFTVLLLTRVSIRRYWEEWDDESHYLFHSKKIHCHNCHLSQPENKRCLRCAHPLHYRTPQSEQKTWALLFAATIAIIPANLIPISILMTNGQRVEDTIFSGVASLVSSGMTGIAAIIFVASIVVPIAKIVGLSYILLAIRFKRQVFHRQRMWIYFVVKWIGKWSMMDLFVISIMMTLVDRGQILDFTPGYGAVAFGMVVVFTMLAAESLDPRLIWDNYSSASKEESLNE